MQRYECEWGNDSQRRTKTAAAAGICFAIGLGTWDYGGNRDCETETKTGTKKGLAAALLLPLSMPLKAKELK